MKVKICGITRVEDALAAVESGADLLGFNFYPKSPRYILPAQCAAIASCLAQAAAPVVLVGVFVNTPPEEMARLMGQCGLHLAQLSGDEPAESLAALPGRAFKALRPASFVELEAALNRYSLHQSVPSYLLDASRPGQFGGTGALADWSLAAHLAKRFPILLAGGLTPDNVAAAAGAVRPWGVDVASGVEASPGIKDPHKMAAFIQAAHRFP